MASYYDLPNPDAPGRRSTSGDSGRSSKVPFLLILLIALVICSRFIAGWIIDYEWWKELGQLNTWYSMLLYSSAPVLCAAVICFATLFIAHTRGLKHAGASLRLYPTYAKLSTLALLVVSVFLALATVDNWTIVRYFGGRAGVATGTYRDPVFGNGLGFYFFDLPFYLVILSVLLAIVIPSIIVYYLAARFWLLKNRFGEFAESRQLDLSDLGLTMAQESKFLRSAIAIALLFIAARVYLGRYEMLLDDHSFMVGVDYVSQYVRLPMNWLAVAASIAAAGLVLVGRFKVALLMFIVIPVNAILPQLVNALYVRPNEISLQKPYVNQHIQATRNGFGLNHRSSEKTFPAQQEAQLNPTEHAPLLENVRLWDWRAFHDTVTQIQPLRPYIFEDTDVDRYRIDGHLRQVLLTPRELDIRQLGDARSRWINPHFIYTHGYGLVVAEANRITSDGLPFLLVKDAPPDVKSKIFSLSRPEMYFGEISHEPVFVRTAQPEFNYPSGSDNVHNRYEGKGGIPISSLGTRLAAAVAYGDPNILLTSYLTAESRMLIRQKVTDRLEQLAGFVAWDPDPYLVVSANGRLVWMVDGYTVSDAHPYSRHVESQSLGHVNYIRNSVKATVDAYDGSTAIYVFDEADPLIGAYRQLFPDLLQAASKMPSDLREHTRYPERLFRLQAETYLAFHMQDPEAFYNKVDLWAIARGSSGEGGRPEPVAPSYLVATVPGSEEPEFLLMIPFTPRGKDNLIGMMVARCDGEKLGELLFLQMPKDKLVFGPMQIEARINQDQNISKDLTLWNQQGSQVLRGQIQVLPIGSAFLYVQPIYIQASEARMPQLKKIVLAMGNNLVYRDTYQQALAELSGIAPATPEQEQPMMSASPAKPTPTLDPQKMNALRNHMKRYRELSAQGRWAEAGKELEALESELNGR